MPLLWRASTFALLAPSTIVSHGRRTAAAQVVPEQREQPGSLSASEADAPNQGHPLDSALAEQDEFEQQREQQGTDRRAEHLAQPPPERNSRPLPRNPFHFPVSRSAGRSWAPPRKAPLSHPSSSPRPPRKNAEPGRRISGRAERGRDLGQARQWRSLWCHGRIKRLPASPRSVAGRRRTRRDAQRLGAPKSGRGGGGGGGGPSSSRWRRSGLRPKSPARRGATFVSGCLSSRGSLGSRGSRWGRGC